MSFFRKFVTIETRLPPAEVERRLRTIVRKPRSFREVLQRAPVNPPTHPDFVGTVAPEGFQLSRLADVPSSVGRFYSPQPSFRGAVMATATGSEIRLTFSDPGLAIIVITLSVGFSIPILANTRGWPLWQLEHAALAGLVAGLVWIYRFSLHREAASSVALLGPKLHARVVPR